jgi:hypothetical protein
MQYQGKGRSWSGYGNDSFILGPLLTMNEKLLTLEAVWEKNFWYCQGREA